MTELDNIRREIDGIDREMAALFSRRMEAAAKVAAYKNEQGLPVLDAGREEALVAQNLARLPQNAPADLYESFLETLMALSRQYQTRLLGRDTVAYQGAEGGFGHQVMTTLYPHGKPRAEATFEEVFEAVERGSAACGVVPFENSSTGDVSGVLDLLYTHQCYITAVYDLPVQQNLLGVPGAKLGDITTVLSHEQGLAQSRRFLESLGVQAVPYGNTATAAREVAARGDKHTAAVASLQAAEQYGLIPLATDISAEADNATRFIIISKERPKAGNRFALLFTVENSVGALARVIETIAAQGFNMENLKSRPMPKRPFEYYFFAELVGRQGASSEENDTLIDAIRRVCLSARLLGVYQRTGGVGS